MGLIFDNETARIFESWYQTSHGRAIERSIEHLIHAVLKPVSGERVLEIGCGKGNHLILFNKLGLDVSGIDASPSMITEARKRLGKRCTLKTGMAGDLPFDDNEFDIAVFINTFEFLDDPLQALREAGRVAQKRVFIGAINSLSLNGLFRKIQGYLGDSLFSHARFYNIWQLKSLLQMAYGPVPVDWNCIKVSPPFIEGMGSLEKRYKDWRHSPFGTFLGLSATMIHRTMTDNLPLKIKVKKAGQSLVGASTLGNMNRSKGLSQNGGQGDERGLSV